MLEMSLLYTIWWDDNKNKITSRKKKSFRHGVTEENATHFYYCDLNSLSTSLLLPGPLWPGMVAPDRTLSMG